MSLKALIGRPYELLVELERRAKAAIAVRQGDDVATDEWVGIGFRLVTDVAIACGYDSVSAFIASFREHFGATPGEFAGVRGER